MKMVKTDRYPSPRRAVPVDFLRPSRTAKILSPAIVFTALVVLALASITGIIVAASVFDTKSPHQPGESAAQVFILIASSISIIYIIVHSLAIFEIEPVGVVRPPEQRIHGYCFISARLGLIAWVVALIASSVVASKPAVCLRWNRDCKLQVLDIACAALAFVASGTLLTALEACCDPFATPKSFHIPRMITCRVSSFEDEFFDRSTTSSLLDDEGVSEQIKRLSAMEQVVSRKQLPAQPPKRPTIPGEFPQMTPSPITDAPKARGWGEEWTHLVRDTKLNKIPRTTSSGSISQSSSTETITSTSSSQTHTSKRVTPSSSISNHSRRSKLSTMRSIEFPDVPVPTELRYLPPVIAPPHEWNVSKTASLTQLLPVAEAYQSPRRASGTPAPLKIMKPMTATTPLLAPILRRTTLDVKIPGAYIDYHPGLSDQSRPSLPVQKMKEVPKVKPQLAPIRLPDGECEMHYSPSRLNSRSRYRHRLQPSLAYSGTDSAVCLDAVKVQYVKPSDSISPVKEMAQRRGRNRRFKPLTLGDISPGLGKIWDD